MDRVGSGLGRTLLVIHVGASVGWLGAVGAFLAVAIAGVSTTSRTTVHGLYEAARVMTWWVILPLAALTLITGLLVATRSRWGLARHYWVLAKLFITVLATIGLVIHLAPVDDAARLAATGTPPEGLQWQLITAAALAAVALALALVLSIVKPAGLTKRGATSSHRRPA